METRTLSGGNLIVIIAAVIGAVAFLNFYNLAFPTASVELNVNRGEAFDIAENYVVLMGDSTEGYKDAVAFDSEDMAVTFLQKTQEPEVVGKVMEEVPVWYWRVRWFRPLEKEEFNVYVDPSSGEVIYFRHSIEETAEGADLVQGEALKIAEDFLGKVVEIDLTGYDSVEMSSEKRDKRTDHKFEWEKKGLRLYWNEEDEEAGYGAVRLSVEVHGDKVGHFKRYLKVPEKFKREHEGLASRGYLLSLGSLSFMFLTGIAALVVFIQQYKKDKVRWKFALTFATIVGVLFILNGVNSFPITKIAYRTEIGYGIFIGSVIIGLVLIAIVYSLIITLTGGAGDSVASEVYPRQVEVISDLTSGKLLTRKFALSSLWGYSLGFIFLGYITLFYLLGRRYGDVWMPSESPYSNILSTSFPFLFPLTVSLAAAVSEEFISRLFSISFLKKYIRSTFLALLIPAIIWAFGHSSYAVYPVYVRGIELTVGGLLFGYFFIRYGLMTCIIGHYVVDAIFLSVPLLKSQNTYFLVLGIAVIALAAIPGFFGLLGITRKSGMQESQI